MLAYVPPAKRRVSDKFRTDFPFPLNFLYLISYFLSSFYLHFSRFDVKCHFAGLQPYYTVLRVEKLNAPALDVYLDAQLDQSSVSILNIQ